MDDLDEKNKYLIFLTVIYIVFALLFWFFYSNTLYAPTKSQDVILRGKIYLFLTFAVFIVLGLVVTLMTKRIENKGFNIIINIIALIICIALTEIFRCLIGTYTDTYLWFVIISFFYGRYSAYCLNN